MSELDTTSSLDIEQSLPTPEEASAHLGLAHSNTCDPATTAGENDDLEKTAPSFDHEQSLPSEKNPETKPTLIFDSKLIYQPDVNEFVTVTAELSPAKKQAINEGLGPNKASFFIDQPLPPPEPLDDSRVLDRSRKECIMALCFFGSMLCLTFMGLGTTLFGDWNHGTPVESDDENDVLGEEINKTVVEALVNPYYGRVGSGRVYLEFEKERGSNNVQLGNYELSFRFRYVLYDMRPCVGCAVYIAEGRTCNTEFDERSDSVSRFVRTEYFDYIEQTATNITYSTEVHEDNDSEEPAIDAYEVLHGNGYSALENYERTVVFLDTYGKGVACGEFGRISEQPSISGSVTVQSDEARWNRARKSLVIILVSSTVLFLVMIGTGSGR